MTFLELEKARKKRRLFKLFKYILIFFVLIGGIGFYYIYNVKNIFSANEENTKKSINKQINKNIIHADKNKTIKKHQNAQIKKQISKLNLILDLNITEPLKTNKTKKIYNSKTNDEIGIKNNKILNTNKTNKIFQIKSETLPSYETCMALAKKYYKEGNYNDALKWAKNANIQDNKKPESWIISAKSLFKLGKKQQALKILNIYYNYHKDKEVKKLMREFNENN
jgi:tetratricopeptide (TPR) repeat protein